MEARHKSQVITTYVPLSEMFGYSTDLRSATQGQSYLFDAFCSL